MAPVVPWLWDVGLELGAFQRSLARVRGVSLEEVKLSGSGGDGASQMVAEVCTYSEGQAGASGIRMAYEDHTTLALASVLGRWRQGGEESKGMGQEGKRVMGTMATEQLGVAPSAPLTGRWVVVVAASQVEQLLGLAEQVLALLKGRGSLVPGMLRQEVHYSKLLLVLLVQVQLERVWVRARGREQMQARRH